MDDNAPASSNGRHGPAKPSSEAVPLRVFRVEPGSTCFVRILSHTYGGCFTHYVKGRSEYCRGGDCPEWIHRHKKVWKGYCAVEVYDKKRKKWKPECLEITEYLELDMRGLFARGQVWELFREADSKDHATPVVGKLQEERDPATCPSPFNFLPALVALFHWTEVELTTENPLPPRVYVQESEGDAPKLLEESNGMSPEESERMHAELRRRHLTKTTPTERQRA